MTNELIKYVRVNRGRNRGTPKGVVMAVKDSTTNTVNFGWSYTAISRGDKFNKERGLTIARERAKKGTGNTVTVPYDIAQAMTYMVSRAKRYFKDAITINEFSENKLSCGVIKTDIFLHDDRDHAWRHENNETQNYN